MSDDPKKSMAERIREALGPPQVKTERFPDEVLKRARAAYEDGYWKQTGEGKLPHDREADAIAAMRAVLEGHLAEQETELVAEPCHCEVNMRRFDTISGLARRGLSFGNQATPKTDEQKIAYRDNRLRDIVDICGRAGVVISPLRSGLEEVEEASDGSPR